MPIYQEYDPINGVILATRVMPEEIAYQMVSDGIALVEGDGSSSTHYVDISGYVPLLREKGVSK